MAAPIYANFFRHNQANPNRCKFDSALWFGNVFIFIFYSLDIGHTDIHRIYMPSISDRVGKKYHYFFSVEIHEVEFRLLLPGQQGES